MSLMPKGIASPSSSSVRPASRFGARSVLAALALVLVAVPFALVLLMVEDKWPPLLRADTGARDSLHGYAVSHVGFVGAMQLISNSGSALAWQIVLAAVVVWLLWRRLPRLALFVVITAAGSSVLNTVVKATVHRLRPVVTNPVAHEGGLSFPSGHAQAAIVGYGVLLLVFLPILHGAWRRLGVALAVFMVLAIGFSRIALGVHYLSDVLGGFVLGGAWLLAMTAAFNAMRVEGGRRPVDRSEGLEPEQSQRLAGHSTSDDEKNLSP